MAPLPTGLDPCQQAPSKLPLKPLSRSRGAAAPLAQIPAHPQHHCALVTPPPCSLRLSPLRTASPDPWAPPPHWAPFPVPSHQPDCCHPAGTALGPSPLLRLPRCPTGPCSTSVHTHRSGCAVLIHLPDQQHQSPSSSSPTSPHPHLLLLRARRWPHCAPAEALPFSPSPHKALRPHHPHC